MAFDPAYEGTPPWDIGKAQPALVELEPEIPGRVLDVGCGTGENAFWFAQHGHDTLGVDASPRAIEKARAKAAARSARHVEFRVADALDLHVDAAFDVAIDSGCFHVFDDDDRPAYARSVGRCLRAGGRLALMCFGDEEAPGWGPRRVSQAEIRETFRDGWRVLRIDAALFEHRLATGHARAWRALIERVG